MKKQHTASSIKAYASPEGFWIEANDESTGDTMDIFLTPVAAANLASAIAQHLMTLAPGAPEAEPAFPTNHTIN